MEYRKDIDGLRAIAVLSVILFHAGFRWFSGGYVGVDIFFVISGFLITGILLREHAAQKFTLAKFYERRARRILPALFVVLFMTAAAAYWLMLPFELRVFAQSITAVVLFSSNILFWKRAGFFDFYFDPPALLNPLLHTWSLGVEEQFYLVFPVLLMLAWRFWRRRLFQLVVLTALASFVYSSLIDGEWNLGFAGQREANFYLLPARAWQLMMGSLMAFWSVSAVQRSPVRRWWRNIASLSGLTLVLFAILIYHAVDIRFTSLYALAPTVGTVLILAYGRGTVVGSILSSPPLVGVGLISYSAYLWHQPLFAFGHYVSLDNEFSTGTNAAFCFATLAVAWASWRWIETPFRDRRTVSRRTLIGVSGFASACLLIAGVTLALSENLPTRGRLLPGGLLQTSRDRVKVMQDCGFRPGTASLGCPLNPASSDTPTFIVIGDSHAAAMLPSFQRLSQRTGQQGRLLALAGCQPLLLAQDAACEPMQAAALDFVKRHNIKSVFLVSRWAWYADQDERRSRPAFVLGLKRTIDAYGDLGVLVHIVEQVPQQTHRPVGIYIQSSLQRDPSTFIRGLSVTRAEHDTRQAFVAATFASYRADGRVKFIDPAAVLCNGGVCPVGTPSQSFYWDESHLSVAGAIFVSDALEDDRQR